MERRLDQALKSATKTIPSYVIAADPVDWLSRAFRRRKHYRYAGIAPGAGGKEIGITRKSTKALSVAFLAHSGDPAHKLLERSARGGREIPNEVTGHN